MLKLLHRFKDPDKFYGLADSGMLSLFRFGCGITMAQFAGVEGFATYTLLLMTMVIFHLLPSALFIIPFLNLGGGLSSQLKFALTRWAWRGILITALLFAVLSATAFLVLPNLKLTTLESTGFITAAIVSLFHQYIRAQLQAAFKQRIALLCDILTITIHILSALCIWHFGATVLAAFFWGTTISASCGSLAKVFIGKINGKEEDKDDQSTKELLRKASHSGRAMLVGSLANSTCTRVQPFAIGLIASMQQVAQYGAIWTLVGPLRMLSVALTSILRPRLSKYYNTQQTKRFHSNFRHALMLVAAFGFAAIVCSFFLGPLVMRKLFGEDFEVASHLLPLSLLYATIDASTSCQIVALQIGHSNGPIITTKLRIQAALLSLSLLVPFTYYWGLTGTISGLLIAELYYAVAATHIQLSTKPSAAPIKAGNTA